MTGYAGRQARAAASRPSGSVSSIPVNGYVLNDRALKYGLLFVVLTFVGVGTGRAEQAPARATRSSTCWSASR
jgi:hypothetical protein